MRRIAFEIVFFAILCAMAAPSALALDRSAFSFTRCDLQLTVDPHQHSLAVEGTVEVRNISSQPQSEAALQISSSLHWLSVLVDGAPAEWLTQSYTSDIDHTGLLSEAIVKFDTPLAPGQSLRLNVRYSGTVLKDATRLERIGAPPDVALRSDWDEISDRFTALRGAGFVVWYPVSMDAANLSQGNELSETLRGWRERQSSSLLRVHLSRAASSDAQPDASPDASPEAQPKSSVARFTFVGNGSPVSPSDSLSGPEITQEFRGTEPVLVLLNDPAQTTDRPHVAAYYTAAHTDAARDYMAAVESIIPPLEEWFGTPHSKVVLVELADPEALPYDAGPYYFVPVLKAPHAAAEVALVRPVVHAMVESPRPWIREGLVGFAQALIRERQAGRHAALDYMGQFSSALAVAEFQSHAAADAGGTAASSPPATGLQPLISTADEIFFRSKAAYVWWMLRDQVGDRPLQSALAAYRAADDRDTGYMQRLVEKQSSPPLDLEWFFDDWVYRDRGLPQLRIDSAYVRKTLGQQTVTAVTVENLGEAGCEVPVMLRSASGQAQQRLQVPAKSKATVRIPLDSEPTEATVNDGSVPESDRQGHVLPVSTAPAAAP